jgi:hypothetical protein
LIDGTGCQSEGFEHQRQFDESDSEVEDDGDNYKHEEADACVADCSAQLSSKGVVLVALVPVAPASINTGNRCEGKDVRGGDTHQKIVKGHTAMAQAATM